MCDVYGYVGMTIATYSASALERAIEVHRLQLSLNLRDSPGFLAIVPRPGRLFYNCINGPGRGPDTSINTVVIVQLITYEQPACGSALQTLVFAVATLQELYWACKFML